MRVALTTFFVKQKMSQLLRIRELACPPQERDVVARALVSVRWLDRCEPREVACARGDPATRSDHCGLWFSDTDSVAGGG